MLSENLRRAVYDVRYLLNREYPRDSVVELVSDHYQLESDKRHLLTRCVFSKKETKTHQSRLVKFLRIEDKELGVDGYNVLITVESILKGDRVIKCDDGIIRDLQAIFGKYKMNDYTEEAVEKILEIISEVSPRKFALFFDKQVSKSGELAGFIRRKIEEKGLSGDAQAIGGVDKSVWEFEISASSDRVIIEKGEKIVDIPKELLKRRQENYLDLTKV